MTVGIGFLLLNKASEILEAHIRDEVSQHWPHISITDITQSEDKPLAFHLDGSPVYIMSIDAPYPWSDLEGPCATSILWPNAEAEIRPHKAHCIVTIMDELSPIDMATKLTQATAIVLGACEEAIGVYWGNATLVIAKPIFRDFALEILPDGYPLYIWVDFRVGSDEPNRTSGFTQGMEALGHMEFEAQGVSESVSDLRERLFDLASYLLTNGPVIMDGDTIGQDADEKIKVCFEASVFGNENKVMRLRYETATPEPAKKPGWKFW
jgi:hypothetical protein